jgi:ABC-type multidrug transport system ATPase subunit
LSGSQSKAPGFAGGYLHEPTNGLDPAGIRDVRELLKRLVRESGITVFLSSQPISFG